MPPDHANRPAPTPIEIVLRLLIVIIGPSLVSVVTENHRVGPGMMPEVGVALASAVSRGTAATPRQGQSVLTIAASGAAQNMANQQVEAEFVEEKLEHKERKKAAPDELSNVGDIDLTDNTIADVSDRDHYVVLEKSLNVLKVAEESVEKVVNDMMYLEGCDSQPGAAAIESLAQTQSLLVALLYGAARCRQHKNQKEVEDTQKAFNDKDDSARPAEVFRPIVFRKGIGWTWLVGPVSVESIQLIVQVLSWREEVLLASNGLEKARPSPSCEVQHRGRPGTVLSFEQRKAIQKKHKEHWLESMDHIRQEVSKRRNFKNAAVGRDLQSYYRAYCFSKCGGVEWLNVFIAIGKCDEDVLECLNQANCDVLVGPIAAGSLSVGISLLCVEVGQYVFGRSRQAGVGWGVVCGGVGLSQSGRCRRGMMVLGVSG